MFKKLPCPVVTLFFIGEFSVRIKTQRLYVFVCGEERHHWVKLFCLEGFRRVRHEVV